MPGGLLTDLYELNVAASYSILLAGNRPRNHGGWRPRCQLGGHPGWRPRWPASRSPGLACGDTWAATNGSQVTIGHNTTLHRCTVEDLVLIGMGAIVLNGARVGRHSIIAAGTVLAEGQQVPEGVLVAGVPGKVRRELSEAERSAIERNAATYLALSRLHRRGGA